MATTKLIDATIALIGQRGLEGFSITEVGERASLSRGLPGHYFKNRDGLVEAAVQLLLAPPSLPANPGLQPLLDSIGRTLTRAHEGSGRMRAFLTVLGASHEGSPHKLEVARFYAGAASFTEAHLRAGVEAGVIDGTINPSSRAPAIVAALVGQAQLAIARPEAVELADLAGEFVALMRAGLASREREKSIHEGLSGSPDDKSGDAARSGAKPQSARQASMSATPVEPMEAAIPTVQQDLF